MSQPRAITLLELMVAIMIIAVLAALSVPKFVAMQERGVDKEARTNLKLIQAAEKIYEMEVGVFWPSDNTTAGVASLNTNLGLDLTAANWDYSVIDSSSGVDLDAQAGRDSGSIPVHWRRRYYIGDETDQACCCPQGETSACPSEDLCTNLGEACPPVW